MTMNVATMMTTTLTTTTITITIHYIQCESKKSPPEDLWQFFQNGWEFFNQILRAYYAFLSTLEYEFLFNYLQLWRSYAISATTQFTSCVQNVHHRPKHTMAFSDIFPEQLGIFRPNFTRLLNVHMHARECKFLYNYLQLWRSYTILSATTIMWMSTIDRNARWVVALNMA